MGKAKVQLGDRVRDSITNFQGIAIGYCRYLNGCEQFELKPEKLHDGATIKGHWFDVQRLEVVEEGAFFKATQQERPRQGPGGPKEHPPARSKP